MSRGNVWFDKVSLNNICCVSRHPRSLVLRVLFRTTISTNQSFPTASYRLALPTAASDDWDAMTQAPFKAIIWLHGFVPAETCVIAFFFLMLTQIESTSWNERNECAKWLWFRGHIPNLWICRQSWMIELTKWQFDIYSCLSLFRYQSVVGYDTEQKKAGIIFTLSWRDCVCVCVLTLFWLYLKRSW